MLETVEESSQNNISSRKSPESDFETRINELNDILELVNEGRAEEIEEMGSLQSTFLLSQQDLCHTLNKSAQALSKYASSKGITSLKMSSKNRGYTNKDVRTILTNLGYTYPKKIIGFQMLKGGSTKTTSLVHLAVRLCHYGAKVLVIDLDPQGNATNSFAVDTSERPIFFDVMTGRASVKDSIVEVSEGLDIIPSDFGNSGLNPVLLTGQKNLKTSVSDIVEPLRDDYDFILMDSNPSLSHINTSIALASDYIVIPVNPNKFSYEGLYQILIELRDKISEYRTDVDFKILFTLYKERDNLSQKYFVKYGKTLQGKLFSSIIKDNTDVKKAIDEKKFIFDKPKALSRKDFDLFAVEVLELQSFSNENLIQ